MPYRLYLVNKETGKCTGKKRDYPSKEHFIKYGIETYERYDLEFYYTNEPTGLRAKLCYLDENNKWVETTEEMRKELGI